MHVVAMKETLNVDYKSKEHRVDLIRTSTYKEEFFGSNKGFHHERKAPPKPLGGFWLELELGGSSQIKSRFTMTS
jgi:hypothetical protein